MDELDQQEDDAEIELLQFLIETKRLKGEDRKVAQQIIDQGKDSLSPEQVLRFNEIDRTKFQKTCGTCGRSLELNEIPEWYDNHRNCPEHGY